MVIRENILNILHVRKHYFFVTRRIVSYLSKENLCLELRSAIDNFQLFNSHIEFLHLQHKPWKKGLLCTDLLIRHIRYRSQVNPGMYEAAWKLVTKCFRNLFSASSLHISRPFPHTSSHVSPIVSPVSLVISHVFPGVFPCFLF